jgi:hypothetical protein
VGRQWRLAFFHLKNRQAENRFKSVFTADCFVSLGKAKSYWRAGGINAAAIAAIPYIPAFSMTGAGRDMALGGIWHGKIRHPLFRQSRFSGRDGLRSRNWSNPPSNRVIPQRLEILSI